jgi:hypothetical protein
VSAKLDNALDGPERMKLWDSQKEVLAQMEAAEAGEKGQAAEVTPPVTPTAGATAELASMSVSDTT